jgi:hypothetical protein
MIRSALEKILTEDISDIWNTLDSDEKHQILDSFTVHNFKKNQLIYAEGDEPEFLWCLLKREFVTLGVKIFLKNCCTVHFYFITLCVLVRSILCIHITQQQRKAHGLTFKSL